MLATAIKTFPITNCPEWQYTTKTHAGTCIVDGMKITMRFTIVLTGPKAVPDVLGIEEACKAMSQEQDTLEGYTAKLATLLGCTVVGKGKTKTHGVITVTICR